MKQKISVFVLAAASGLLTVALAADASAQSGVRWRGSQGWGRGSDYARLYDAKTVETVKGEVVSVQTFTPGKGMGYGVHLQLKTDKETLSVHLGPNWYIENQDTKIEANDVVEVRGSRVTFEGKPTLIAAEVKKGEETLRLRDQDGYPAWAGWRRR
jgi:hypothetical protein